MTGILQIIQKKRDNVDVVCVSGRLDTNTSIEADAVLNRLIASGSQNILINCENLDYIRSIRSPELLI